MATTKRTGQDTLGKLRSKTGARMTTGARASVLDRLGALYATVKSNRLAEAWAKESAKRATVEAVALATEAEALTTPVSFVLDGVSYTGEIVSPMGSPTWDLEKVVDYLHKSGKWDACSTRVFDQDKWESEVQSGNIPPRTANGFKIPGKPGTQYVKITKK